MSDSVYSGTLRAAAFRMAWLLLLPAAAGVAQPGGAGGAGDRGGVGEMGEMGEEPGVLTRVFDGETLRDPTQPPGASLPVQADGGIDQALLDAGVDTIHRFRVSFIRSGGSQPMAVINDEPVTVGEQISGARVVAIMPGQVELDVDGESRTIRPWQGNTVREAASEQQTDPQDEQNP